MKNFELHVPFFRPSLTSLKPLNLGDPFQQATKAQETYRPPGVHLNEEPKFTAPPNTPNSQEDSLIFQQPHSIESVHDRSVVITQPCSVESIHDRSSGFIQSCSIESIHDRSSGFIQPRSIESVNDGSTDYQDPGSVDSYQSSTSFASHSNIDYQRSPAFPQGQQQSKVIEDNMNMERFPPQCIFESTHQTNSFSQPMKVADYEVPGNFQTGGTLNELIDKHVGYTTHDIKATAEMGFQHQMGTAVNLDHRASFHVQQTSLGTSGGRCFQHEEGIRDHQERLQVLRPHGMYYSSPGIETNSRGPSEQTTYDCGQTGQQQATQMNVQQVELSQNDQVDYEVQSSSQGVRTSPSLLTQVWQSLNNDTGTSQE